MARGFVPFKKSRELLSEGKSEPEIIDILRDEGFSAEEIDIAFTQILKLRDVTENLTRFVYLKQNEEIEYISDARYLFGIDNKGEEVSIGGDIVFTTEKFCFLPHPEEKVKKGMFRTERVPIENRYVNLEIEVPYYDVDNCKSLGWRIYVKLAQQRKGKYKELFRTDYLGRFGYKIRETWYVDQDRSTLGFVFPSHEEGLSAYRMLEKLLDDSRKRKKVEEREERKIEVVHRGAVGVVDFGKLVDMMGKKGLALQVIECPNCGGKVDVPKDGSITKCKNCGKNIHAVNIFEKFKSILGG